MAFLGAWWILPTQPIFIQPSNGLSVLSLFYKINIFYSLIMPSQNLFNFPFGNIGGCCNLSGMAIQSELLSFWAPKLVLAGPHASGCSELMWRSIPLHNDGLEIIPKRGKNHTWVANSQGVFGNFVGSIDWVSSISTSYISNFQTYPSQWYSINKTVGNCLIITHIKGSGVTDRPDTCHIQNPLYGLYIWYSLLTCNEKIAVHVPMHEPQGGGDWLAGAYLEHGLQDMTNHDIRRVGGEFLEHAVCSGTYYQFMRKLHCYPLLPCK